MILNNGHKKKDKRESRTGKEGKGEEGRGKYGKMKREREGKEEEKWERGREMGGWCVTDERYWKQKKRGKK